VANSSDACVSATWCAAVTRLDGHRSRCGSTAIRLKYSAGLRVLLVGVMALAVAACADRQTTDAVFRSRSMLYELSKGDFGAAMALTAPEERSTQAMAGLREAGKLIPPGRPSLILTLRSHYRIYPSATVVDLSEEYYFPSSRAIIFDTIFQYRDRAGKPELVTARLYSANGART